MMFKFFSYLKALASLVGVALTAAATAAEMPTWVTVAGVVATAVATWAVPNLDVEVVE